MYRKEVEAKGLVATDKGKPKPLLRWGIDELLRVAATLEWLPKRSKPKVRLKNW
jgi:hypothetical protein